MNISGYLPHLIVDLPQSAEFRVRQQQTARAYGPYLWGALERSMAATPKAPRMRTCLFLPDEQYSISSLRRQTLLAQLKAELPAQVTLGWSDTLTAADSLVLYG